MRVSSYVNPCHHLQKAARTDFSKLNKSQKGLTICMTILAGFAGLPFFIVGGVMSGSVAFRKMVESFPQKKTVKKTEDASKIIQSKQENSSPIPRNTLPSKEEVVVTPNLNTPSPAQNDPQELSFKQKAREELKQAFADEHSNFIEGSPIGTVKRRLFQDVADVPETTTNQELATGDFILGVPKMALKITPLTLNDESADLECPLVQKKDEFIANIEEPIITLDIDEMFGSLLESLEQYRKEHPINFDETNDLHLFRNAHDQAMKLRMEKVRNEFEKVDQFLTNGGSEQEAIAKMHFANAEYRRPITKAELKAASSGFQQAVTDEIIDKYFDEIDQPPPATKSQTEVEELEQQYQEFHATAKEVMTSKKNLLLSLREDIAKDDAAKGDIHYFKQCFSKALESQITKYKPRYKKICKQIKTEGINAEILKEFKVIFANFKNMTIEDLEAHEPLDDSGQSPKRIKEILNDLPLDLGL